MLFHDEIRPAKDIPAGGRSRARRSSSGAVALIEALAVDWDPTRYEDRYRERLLDVVKRKKKGKRITAPTTRTQPAPVPDLMAALEESLKAAKGGGAAGRTAATTSPALSRDELYERAQDADVPGRSSMSKDELVEALDQT